MRRLAALSMILLFAACGAGPADTPTPPDKLTPLVPTGGIETAVAAQRVTDPDGAVRTPGLISALVEDDFNTGTLTEGGAQIELVEDRTGRASRLLLLRVSDLAIDAALELVRSLAGVKAAEPYRHFTGQVNDPYWPQQSYFGLWMLNLQAAWWMMGDGAARVAVVDTGVDPVAELAGRLAPGYGAIGNPEDTTDGHGHGTQVATIIAARRDNRTGIAGVSPGSTIVPVKACVNFQGIPDCGPFPVYAAMDWLIGEAAGGAVDVVNLSFGAPGTDGVLEDYLETLDGFGVIIVAAAGNAGTSTVYHPARSEHAVAVGGATITGARHTSSSYGAELDVLGPHVTYAVSGGGAAVTFPGTSGATAVIAGLAALFKSTQPTGFWSERARFIEAMAAERTWSAETGYGVPYAPRVLWPNYCPRFDLDASGAVGVADEQRIAYHYGRFYGQLLYETRYDLEPVMVPDGDIDIKDLQKILGKGEPDCP